MLNSRLSYLEQCKRADKLAKEALRKGREEDVYSPRDSYLDRKIKEEALRRNKRI